MEALTLTQPRPNPTRELPELATFRLSTRVRRVTNSLEVSQLVRLKLESPSPAYCTFSTITDVTGHKAHVRYALVTGHRRVHPVVTPAICQRKKSQFFSLPAAARAQAQPSG